MIARGILLCSLLLCLSACGKGDDPKRAVGDQLLPFTGQVSIDSSELEQKD